jgi:hypothetical protein
LLTEYFKRDLYRDFVDYYKAHAPQVVEQKPEPVQQVQEKHRILQVQPSGPVQLDLFSMWDEQEAVQPVQPEAKPKDLTPD